MEIRILKRVSKVILLIMILSSSAFISLRKLAEKHIVKQEMVKTANIYKKLQNHRELKDL